MKKLIIEHINHIEHIDNQPQFLHLNLFSFDLGFKQSIHTFWLFSQGRLA